MLPRRLLLGLGVSCLALAAALAYPPRDGERTAHAAAKPEAKGPRTALVATRPGAELSSLYVVRAGDSENLAPVATFNHLPDATVRAAVVPGAEIVLATADTTLTRDPSFNASLFRLTPHAPPETLVDRVVHASRPLVTRAARIFVARGIAGNEVEGQMRIDALAIDEVNASTGQTQSIHAANALFLHIVGEAGREIVLYRVFPDHADIVGVDPDSMAVRVIEKSIPPFARDFSIDAEGRTIVLQNRHETDARTWVVDRIDVATGKTQRLFASPSMTLAPSILPRGSVLFNPPGRGLSALEAPHHVAGPLGPGVDVVAASTPDEVFVAALHTQPSAFATPFLVETTTGAAIVLPAPNESRIALAGFFPESGGAR